MKFLISIKGMHCTGCSNLIQMNLEDAGFQNVKIDQSNNAGFMEYPSEDKVETTNHLIEAFKEMPDYKYTNLQIIK